jgi:hypothetical protein
MVWALYMEVLLARYVRLDLALITGMAMGIAVLNKTSGFFSIYLLPFSLLVFNFEKKERTKRLIKWISFSFISVAFALAMYMILRLSPFFYIIDEKNALFVFPFSEWIKHPFYYLSGNLNALFSWFSTYISVPILTLAMSAFLIKGFYKEKLLLLIWFVIPFAGLVFFGKTLYPRFIYFMTIPLLILAAYTFLILLDKISSKIIAVVLLTAVLFMYILSSYNIIFNFARSPIPKADLEQYINSWPAGGGIKEMIAFFDEESKKGKIYVGTQGTFGSLPTNSMEIYLGNNKNIETKGFYPLNEVVPQEVLNKVSQMPVYFVFNDSEKPPVTWPIELVAKYRKGVGKRHLSIYKFNSFLR